MANIRLIDFAVVIVDDRRETSGLVKQGACRPRFNQS
jgi:hypothetical protein